MANILIAYVPVLHRGYLDFFERHRGCELWLLGDWIREEFPPLKKDLRVLPAETAALAVRALAVFPTVEVARLEDLVVFLNRPVAVVMPDEEECRLVAERWLTNTSVRFEPVFLRYDRRKATAETQVFADFEVTEGELHRRYMVQAGAIAAQSPDWWRQIGAVAVKDGEVLFAGYNRPVPTERETLYHGDPRANFKAGVEIEASLVLHSEVGIVAEAARRGVSLEGASLYVTTFPCAPCAKAVAYAGVHELYFRDGYSRTDAQEVLRAKGVKIVRVAP